MIFEEIAFSALVAFWTRFWTLLASLSGAFWPPRWLKPVFNCSWSGQEPIHMIFFRLQEPPRALQEASKRLSEGFRVEYANRTPFWTHFWLQKESPTQKYEFYDFVIFTLDHFRTSIWDPPGLLSGDHLAPKIAETGLQGPLVPSKSRS